MDGEEKEKKGGRKKVDVVVKLAKERGFLRRGRFGSAVTTEIGARIFTFDFQGCSLVSTRMTSGVTRTEIKI